MVRTLSHGSRGDNKALEAARVDAIWCGRPAWALRRSCSILVVLPFRRRCNGHRECRERQRRRLVLRCLLLLHRLCCAGGCWVGGVAATQFALNPQRQQPVGSGGCRASAGAAADDSVCTRVCLNTVLHRCPAAVLGCWAADVTARRAVLGCRAACVVVRRAVLGRCRAAAVEVFRTVVGCWAARVRVEVGNTVLGCRILGWRAAGVRMGRRAGLSAGVGVGVGFGVGVVVCRTVQCCRTARIVAQGAATPRSFWVDRFARKVLRFIRHFIARGVGPLNRVHVRRARLGS